MLDKKTLELKIRNQRKAVLIVNTHSRNGARLFSKALHLLNAQGLDLVATYSVKRPELLSGIVREVLGQGHQFVIVGGGDGTFNSIIDEFMYRDVVLGILPLGTANNFARSMGIPMDLEGAVDVLFSGKVVDVDLGRINDQYFLNIAAIGFSQDVIHATPRKLKRFLGVASYVFCEMKYLITQELFRCTITIDGRSESFNTRQMIIANGSFYGTRRITPDAHIDNKTLIIFAMDSFSRLQGLKFWIGFIFGRHLTFPESKVYRTSNARIETIPEKYVIMGGEKSSVTPVELSVASEALTVMAPISFEDYDPSPIKGSATPFQLPSFSPVR